ncbi:MAG: cadherin repeat domain-containing protein [Pseudomonadota bacterium]
MLKRKVAAARLLVLVCASILSACGGGGGGGGSNSGGGGGGGTTNQPPSFSGPTSFSFAENVTVSFTLDVTDPDSASVTITEVAGGDSGLFSLDTNTGVVTASTPNNSFNFEDPEDGNSDNVYEQQVRLSDGTNSVTETITVTITDVDEGPEFAAVSELLLDENATGEIVTFVATDPEGGMVSDFQITEVSKLGEPVNAQRLLDAFELDPVTGALSVVVPFDAEVEGTQDVITVGVSATDGTNEGTGGVTIRLVDLPGRPVDALRISGEGGMTGAFGDTATPVGDFDGDGIDEVFVGALTGSDATETGYLLWGSSLRSSLLAAGAEQRINELQIDARVVFTGDDRNQTVRQSRLTGVRAGDIDSDGVDDLVILMREERTGIQFEEEDNGPLAYVVWGSALERGVTDRVSLTALPATEGVAIGGLLRQAADGVSGTAGDFDGDGQSDVVLGIPAQGRTFVVFGDALSATTGLVDLSSAANTTAISVRSETDTAIIEQTGRRTAVMADLTSDGIPELVISGEGLEPNFQSGAYVVDGSLIADAKGSVDQINVSEPVNDNQVVEVSGIDISPDSIAVDGDSDADGLNDLAIGHSGSNGVTRVATVVYGDTIAAAFGGSDEIDLNFTSATEGVAISDDGSMASQIFSVDPVRVQWIGNADGVAGDEIMVGVAEASPLGRERAGYLLVFTEANLASSNGDLRIDSTNPDPALVRVLQGYGSEVRTGRELFAFDLDGDAALDIGSASLSAGNEGPQFNTGGLVIFAGIVVSAAIAQPDGASDMATTVIVEAP